MSKKNELDQYYTNPEVAAQCIELFKEVIPYDSRRVVIEPSAGNGSFYSQYRGNILGFDLEPLLDGIEKRDFFTVNRSDVNNLKKSKVAFIGNPPFGFASSLAIDFFNHAAKIGNVIAFIIPKTFKKDSVQNKLNLNFHLIEEMDLPKNSFILHGNEYDVPCVFQIWKWKREKREIVSVNNTILEFVSKDEATDDTFCVRRVGGRAGCILHGLDHTSSSTYFVNALQPGVKESIPLIDRSVVDYTAGVRSISKNELVSEIMKVYYQEKI